MLPKPLTPDQRRQLTILLRACAGHALGLEPDDLLCKALAVVWRETLPAVAEVIGWRYGSAKIYIEQGRYKAVSIGRDLPHYRPAEED